MKAIGTQLRDPINSGLTPWRVAVSKKNGCRRGNREESRVNQAPDEYGDEQADAGRDCRTRLARPNSQAQTGREIFIFPVQLAKGRIGNLTRLILTPAICDHIYSISTTRLCS